MTHTFLDEHHFRKAEDHISHMRTAICKAVIGNFTGAENFRGSLHTYQFPRFRTGDHRITNTLHLSRIEYDQRILYDINGGHSRKALRECDEEETVKEHWLQRQHHSRVRVSQTGNK